MQANNLLGPEQFEFKTGITTGNAVFKLTHWSQKFFVHGTLLNLDNIYRTYMFCGHSFVK